MGTATGPAPDSVPGRSVRPGRSPPVLGCGDLFSPVRDHLDDRHCRGRSGACGRELLVVSRLPCSDCSETPYVEKPLQQLIIGRVVRGIDGLVVLVEELLALWLREVTEDHQRIGGVFRRLCDHVIQLMPARRLSL